MELQTRLVPGVGRLPYPAYRGNEPYIFVSYAHIDSPRVFDEIRRFNEAGFHVWYDEGIAPGNEWTDEIANALDRCSLFVVMITPASVPRQNVLNEINYALDENKPFLAIHLEKTELKGGLKLRISSKQAILKYVMSEEEYAFKFTEAFLRFGLARRDIQSSPVSAAVTCGDYVMKGTALITNGLGKEFRAAGNSLVYRPAGKTEFQTLRGLVSMDRSPNGYILKDTSGKETILKTHPGDELLYLGAEETKGLGFLNPVSMQINMVRTIRTDYSETPERKIRYCEVRTGSGSFKTPREFLFFALQENGKPEMTLRKDLNPYAQSGHASLLMMKKLTVVKAGTDASEIQVQYPGGDSETFGVSGGLAVYAMAEGGEMRLVTAEELREIEVLEK